MLKNILAVAAVVLLPLTAAASQLPDYPFVHVSASGSLYVPPDAGEIDFEVSAFDPSRKPRARWSKRG